MLLRNFLLLTLSAFLYALALPNEIYHFGNSLYGFIALVPFFFTLYHTKTISRSILASAYFGILSTGLIYFWLLFFQDFSLWTLSGVIFAHMLFFIFLGPILSAAAKYPPYLRPLLIAGIWVIYEYFKSIGYLALPWGLLAHTAGNFLPLIQISDITGQWGVSFLIALINVLILEIATSLPKVSYFRQNPLSGTVIFTGILLVVTFLYGFYSLNKEIPVVKRLDAILVQQDADSWIVGNEMESIRKGQILTRTALKDTKIKPDIIVWSENAFRYPYTDGSVRYQRNPKGDSFNDFLGEVDVPVLVGSPYILNPKTYSALNAVLLISPDGRILQYYGKTHPVPFAENVPFWNIPFIQSFFQNVLGFDSEGWTVGEPDILFTIKNKDGENIYFGAPICFEDSFPNISRSFFLHGADILINLSNDSWSKTISGETQHYIAAKFRAVENRRVIVRSTNAGVTAVVDPYGRARSMLPLFTSRAEIVTIPVYKTGSFTFYTLFGDWFPILLLILLVGIQLRTVITGYRLFSYRFK